VSYKPAPRSGFKEIKRIIPCRDTHVIISLIDPSPFLVFFFFFGGGGRKERCFFGFYFFQKAFVESTGIQTASDKRRKNVKAGKSEEKE